MGMHGIHASHDDTHIDVHPQSASRISPLHGMLCIGYTYSVGFRVFFIAYSLLIVYRDIHRISYHRAAQQNFRFRGRNRVRA